MLRFDVPPVDANVVRWEAFVTFVIASVALLVTPWVLAFSLAQGLVRGFLGHFKCPSHRFWARFFEVLGLAGKRENAGAKMFANKVLAVASGAALVLYAWDLSIWRVPCVALIAFSFMEWAFSFCAACWVYGFWYSHFPPKAG